MSEKADQAALAASAALATKAAGEGLRGLALTWVAIALSMLAVAALFSATWYSIIVLVLTMLALLIGLAYWWVVPAPLRYGEADALEQLADQLRNAAAVQDAARRVARVSLLVTVGLTLIALALAPQELWIKLGEIVGGGVAAGLAAWWWASCQFDYHEEQQLVVPSTARILYNGRFLLGSLRQLHTRMRRIRKLEPPLIAERNDLVRQALATTVTDERRELLERAAFLQIRYSALMGVHDRFRLPAQELDRIQTLSRRTLSVTALTFVPTVLFYMVCTSVLNLYWRWLWHLTPILRAVALALDEWQKTPYAPEWHEIPELASMDPRESQLRDLMKQMLTVAADTAPNNAKTAMIERLLEEYRSAGTSPEVEQLERYLASWFGEPLW